MTRRVVLGVRVSTDDKNQDPTNQLEPLRAAVARQGWTVATEIVMEGLSAWNAREAAEVKRRFLAPIVAGQADTLAVWCLDRVVRGGIEPTLAFVRELEEHLGADLFSLQESWASTATMDPRTRQPIMALMAWVAQEESNRKSERVKAKVAAKRNRTDAVGQRGRWGRGSRKGEAGTLPSHEDQQKAWVMRDEGKTVRAIAQALGLSKSSIGRILGRPRPVPKEPLGQAGGASDGGGPSQGGPLGQASDNAGAAGGPT